jgi:hypothetical protein
MGEIIEMKIEKKEKINSYQLIVYDVFELMPTANYYCSLLSAFCFLNFAIAKH